MGRRTWRRLAAMRHLAPSYKQASSSSSSSSSSLRTPPPASSRRRSASTSLLTTSLAASPPPSSMNLTSSPPPNRGRATSALPTVLVPWRGVHVLTSSTRGVGGAPSAAAVVRRARGAPDHDGEVVPWVILVLASACSSCCPPAPSEAGEAWDTRQYEEQKPGRPSSEGSPVTSDTTMIVVTSGAEENCSPASLCSGAAVHDALTVSGWATISASAV